jgi:hypothetical protein
MPKIKLINKKIELLVTVISKGLFKFIHGVASINPNQSTVIKD